LKLNTYQHIAAAVNTFQYLAAAVHSLNEATTEAVLVPLYLTSSPPEQVDGKAAD
jgi:hypothetical protein